MVDVPVPISTPEIEHAERVNGRLLKVLVIFAVATLVASAALVWYRFSDQAKQSTTQQAATRALVAAERQDCRADYRARRDAVVEAANSSARDVLAVTIGYLLSLNSTDDIQVAKVAQDEANVRVAALDTLTDMVDNGWTDEAGIEYPPCPVVR